jgi:hypothetical protein
MVGALAAATLLGGCAAMRTVSSEVSTFGDWPAGRAPGRYAFERLPSQQSRAAESDVLEASARAALAKAGFTPVAAGTEPDVYVQLGARESGVELQLWDDPLWWRGGFGGGRYGPWTSPRWGAIGGFGGFGPRFGGLRSERYEHQVALLIRDRVSGKPLFEARAVSEASSPARAETLGAMFEAALTDFPRLGINPRTVEVMMPR